MTQRGTMQGERAKGGDPSPFTQADEAGAQSTDGVTDAQATDASERIAREAYYRAERRGFAPGYEVDDWLEAERELVAKPGPLARGVR